MKVLAIPYLIFSLLLFFFSFKITSTENIINVYYKKIQVFVLFCFVLFFLGLRGFIYTDFYNYYEGFKVMPRLQSSLDEYKFFLKSGYKHWEKGFILYVYFLKSISTNYFVFQFISVFIDVYILYKIFWKNCSSYFLLCFVLYFTFSGFIYEINLQRNVKAMLLFLISVEQYKKNNRKFYYFFNLLGCFFHITSVIYILLGPILFKKWKKSVVFFVFLVGNVVYLFKIEYLKKILPFVGELLPGTLGSMILGYLQNEIFSRGLNSRFTIGFLERTFSFCLIFTYSDKLNKIYNNNCYVNCFYIYIFLYLFCSEIIIIVERLTNLFVMSYWILYPQILTFLSKEKKKLFYFIFLSYFLVKIYSLNSSSELCRYQNLVTGFIPYEQSVNRLNIIKGL